MELRNVDIKKANLCCAISYLLTVTRVHCGCRNKRKIWNLSFPSKRDRGWERETRERDLINTYEFNPSLLSRNRVFYIVPKGVPELVRSKLNETTGKT